MGLDLYAGTLTRYYSGNWKTAVQTWAEANGVEFHKATPEGEYIEEDPPDAAEVQLAVEAWRDQLVSVLKNSGAEAMKPWLEDNEKDYFTDKPDWDAFGAMLLTAACRTYDEPVPSSISKGWDFGEHPLIVRLGNDEERVWSLFRGAALWIPSKDSFMFEAPLVSGDSALIGTTAGLKRELERLNQMHWNAEESEILTWSETEGYPAAISMDSNGRILGKENAESDEYEVESLAKFAFSIFWRAARFAEENDVAVVLDY